MKRVHLIVSGDVQGVGFRAWAKRQAVDLGLTGWVKNREDEAVELVAEGSKVELQELIKRCKRGPDIAWVKNIDVQWSEETREFVTFSVLY